MSLALSSVSSIIPTDMGSMLQKRTLTAGNGVESLVRDGAMSQGGFLKMSKIGANLKNVNSVPGNVIKSAFKGNTKLLSAVEKVLEKTGAGTLTGVLGGVGGVAGLANIGNITSTLSKIGGGAGKLINGFGGDSSNIVGNIKSLF